MITTLSALSTNQVLARGTVLKASGAAPTHEPTDVAQIQATPPATTAGRLKGLMRAGLLTAALLASGTTGYFIGFHQAPPPERPAVVATQPADRCLPTDRQLRGYIASPLIFLPGAFNQGGMMDTVKAEFLRHGFEPLTPLDNPSNYNRDQIPEGQLGFEIAKGDYGLIDRADFVIANLTPWPPDPQGRHERVASADAGTIAEAAYALGKGKPVFIFTNSEHPYYKRIMNMHGVDKLNQDPTIPELFRTPDGIMVDVTGGFDNLMLPAIAPLSGGTVHIITVDDPSKFYTDLSGLRRALQDVQRMQQAGGHCNR